MFGCTRLLSKRLGSIYVCMPRPRHLLNSYSLFDTYLSLNCYCTALNGMKSVLYSHRTNKFASFVGLFCEKTSLRVYSSLLDLGSPSSSKVEQFMKNATFENLKTEFDIGEDEDVYNLLKEKEALEENLRQLIKLKEAEDNSKSEKEMLQLIEEDEKKFQNELKRNYEKILKLLIPRDDFENCNDIVVEISAGVGGLEAMLFTSELKIMYMNYIANKGWECSLAENDESDLGGVRHCSLLVSGRACYATLQYEAGVHRVQRVPTTERGGRMHTSTVSVAVLPQPSDVEVNVKDSDLKIETKRAGGAGGQHVNTTDSAVRITHLPTRTVVECQTGRNQHQNKATALARLKAIIYQKELDQVDSSIRNRRKAQIGTSGRSEKIRTYNYRDGRISDHRLSINVHNLEEFLEGGESLDKLIGLLKKWHYQHKVQRFIESLPT